jgi:hypothetical protein
VSASIFEESSRILLRISFVRGCDIPGIAFDYIGVRVVSGKCINLSLCAGIHIWRNRMHGALWIYDHYFPPFGLLD